ncbi:MAG: acyl transferase [Lewinellaceae bacterium]|nr:acyl transferase [Lewinellaceae bacterium]
MGTLDRAVLLSKLADGRPEDFEALAWQVFRYQAAGNVLYARYLELLGRRPEQISNLSEIPLLPASLFKKYAIQTGDWAAQTEFSSSSTTGQTPSRHLVRDIDFYLENARRGFAAFYGDPSEWCVLALLPSYLERAGSSLVAMADYFIRLSGHPRSGFFLHNYDDLCDALEECRAAGTRTLLLGVSFALLDFAERCPMDLSGITIMETGGMKGRRKELTRQELHAALRQAFGVTGVHSEYGMTELFSQAYSRPGGGTVPVFAPSATLRAVAHEIYDPLCPAASGRTGVLGFVDLANLDTCSFIATEDVGRVHADGTFEVLGRLDAAEWRGCNLMVE